MSSGNDVTHGDAVHERVSGEQPQQRIQSLEILRRGDRVVQHQSK